MATPAHTLPAERKISSRHLAVNNSIIPPTLSPDLAPSDFHLSLHLKSFLAGRQFHDDEVKEAVTTCFALQAASFYDKRYKNWCNAMTIASTMVETMLKNSVRYVHQMAIYMVCNVLLFFFNIPSELTLWISLVRRRTYFLDIPRTSHIESHVCSSWFMSQPSHACTPPLLMAHKWKATSATVAVGCP